MDYLEKHIHELQENIDRLKGVIQYIDGEKKRWLYDAFESTSPTEPFEEAIEMYVKYVTIGETCQRELSRLMDRLDILQSEQRSIHDAEIAYKIHCGRTKE